MIGLSSMALTCYIPKMPRSLPLPSLSVLEVSSFRSFFWNEVPLVFRSEPDKDEVFNYRLVCYLSISYTALQEIVMEYFVHYTQQLQNVNQ